ncbi:MAG TPA: tetratricopeptide repeat protein [Steroidobacteraceae bacterium]
MSFADPLQQAHHFADQGHYQEAWRLLQQVLDISPQNHRAWTLRAQLALRLQRKDLALTAVKTALTLAPQDAAAHYVYGRVHKACGDLPAAIDCYRYATLLEPDNADMLTSLGLHCARAACSRRPSQRIGKRSQHRPGTHKLIIIWPMCLRRWALRRTPKLTAPEVSKACCEDSMICMTRRLNYEAKGALLREWIC